MIDILISYCFIYTLLSGRKDDFYIYDTSQRLVKYVSGREGSLTNFGWKDELYDMLSR